MVYGGHPVLDVKERCMTVHTMKWTSEMAFKIAGSMAFKEGMGPILFFWNL